MKFRIAIVLILLSLFDDAIAHAQNNCCNIKPGPVQISGEKDVTIPPSGNNPGGTYTQTITQTYVIQCINSSTGSSCNTSPPTPNNVVTGTGYGAYSAVLNRFVVCNPIFTPSTTQSTSTTSGTFENVATNYKDVDPNNGSCVKDVPTSAASACPTPAQVAGAACPASPPPPCPGSCTPNYDNNDTSNPADWCTYPDTGCSSGYFEDGATGCCAFSNTSPILIDTTGRGFFLTDAEGGVLFDILGTGHPIQMGWTAPGAANAFLALPGADGLVHNGKQLFGNFTAQPVSKTPNGFAALAVYDLPANGGNGDGIIDSRDAIFSSLRLWIDANHDGVSQLEELHTLASLGVTSISLNYTADRRTDQFGNVFRYRAQVDPGDPTNTGRMAYDVFFVRLHSPTTKNNPPSLIPNSLPSLMPVDAHKCAVPALIKGGMLSTSRK